MGIMEEVAPSHHVTIESRDFVRSTQNNDHSNPQQGTGVGTMQANVQMKQATVEQASVEQATVEQATVQQATRERHPATTKSIAPSSSNYVEDKRKLFVGGLPTDSKLCRK